MKRKLRAPFVTLLVLVITTGLFAQNTVDIRGKVESDTRELLPGVNVSVKGTNLATVTDTEGKYQLSVPASATLVFSYIGYVSEEIAVGNKTEINVTLLPDIRALSEVTVVGYGTQRKIETTGAIASIKADELKATPIVNVAQGIQARVAGVQITQNSGAPGGNISVKVRGTNSINGTTEPLFVIDGIQISNGGDLNSPSPLSQINPNDIESIEVLKDASATAIYGSRAANGVVLITTKRGKSGATRVSYDGYYGTQQTNKTLDVLNAREFGELENEIYKRPVYAEPTTLGEGTDWQKLIFREAAIQSHQLTVSGGSAKTQVLLSGNFFQQKGIIINSDFTRYTLRLNLDHQISERLKVGTSLLSGVSINNNVFNAPQSTDVSGTTSGILGAALAAPPTLVPYREDGTLFPFADQMDGNYREVVNPLGIAAVLNRQNVRRTLANVFLEASLLKGFTYRASFNADLSNGLSDYYSPQRILSQSQLLAGGGSASKGNNYGQNLLHESIFTYRTKIADQHSLTFTGVVAVQGISNEYNTINASKFPNDATLNDAVQLAIDRTVLSGKADEKLNSYMGRFNYGYRDKYFLDVTARADGNSKFGANNKWGFFPAVAAAWRVIGEDFMNSQTLFSDLKLRASWGITGNAGAIGPYASLATVSGSESYNLEHTYVVGIRPTGIPNRDLRWEKSIQTNVGLDVGLFDNRLSLVVDYYQKLTNDLLFVKQLPLSSGYADITGNFARLENKGLELALNGKILTGNLKWDASGNISFNRNQLLELDGTLQEPPRSNYSVIRVGEPLGLFKTYVFDGIYQSGEAILPGGDGRLGGHKVKDLNGDGAITAADQTLTGNANPNFIWGFSTTLRYQNFDLSAFVQGVQGNQLFNLIRYNLENPLGQRNMYQGMANRWSPTNPSNEYASGFQAGRLPFSSRFVEDGSFTRIKNITLGYTFPAVKGLASARLYLSLNNPFTFTRYSGYDPEVNVFPNATTLLGIDNGVYPVAKSYLVGLQINF